MTAQELIDRANSEIQQNSGDKFTSTQMLSILNEGYMDFCRFTLILDSMRTLVISALSSYIELPTNFIDGQQVRWGQDRQVFPASERKLDYNQRDWVFEVGTPEAFTYSNYNTMRLKPITSAAGTITWRYLKSPTDLTITDEPEFMVMFHDALTYFLVAECLWISRKYDEAAKYWQIYLEERQKARSQSRQYQKSPDTFVGQRPLTVFNWPYWDSRFRSTR